MNKILIIFAHPALEKSRINRRSIRELDKKEGVTFHDIYEAYPEFDIDVDKEQTLLSEHDILIFQHPMFWYSVPAILKEWMDLVLEHGWAYGTEGEALKGKTFLSIVTTGGSEEAYQKDGYNRFTLKQLLAPIEQTFYLCKMNYLPPLAIHGTHKIDTDELKTIKTNYHQLLDALINDKFDYEKAFKVDKLNHYLDQLIRE